MFYGLPGMIVEMPKILYPAPLPQYDDVSVAKVSEETVPAKPGGVWVILLKLTDCFAYDFVPTCTEVTTKTSSESCQNN